LYERSYPREYLTSEVIMSTASAQPDEPTPDKLPPAAPPDTGGIKGKLKPKAD